MSKTIEVTAVRKAGSFGSFLEGVQPYHWLVFVGCWMGGIFDGMDSTLYSVVQFDAIAEVSGETAKAVISQMGSYIMATFLLGWTLGGIVFGMIGDRLGRVTAMVLSILLYALFTGAAGFAQTEWQLALCRFLVGFGIGGELVTIATMLSETWPERSRAWAVGSLITSYQMGVFLAGLISTWVYDHFTGLPFSTWRIVFFIGALPAVLAVLLRLKLDEPEKWKLEHAKRAEHPENVTETPWLHRATAALRAIFKPEHIRDLAVGGAIFGGLLIGYWASLSWIPTWIQELVGPNTSGTEKSIATQFHGIAAVLGCFMAGPLANALGRKTTIIIGYLGCFFASWFMFTTNTGFTPAIYWQDALLGFFIGLSQAIMYIYLPELFPTRIRATATGFCLNVGRALTTVAVLFVGYLTTEVFGTYEGALLAFSCAYLVAVLAGLFARETRHSPLPD